MKKEEVLNYLILLLVFFLLFSSILYPVNSSAAETAALKGRVTDIKGSPAEGAELFIYDSTRIRRPADFISPKTDKEGRFQVYLPAGKYWVVARVRSSGEYGPLMPGDKHSGEPLDIELIPGKDAEYDFVVSDIRETARQKQKIRQDYIKVTGRIVDEKGVPVKIAYAFAYKSKVSSQFPDYISSWIDEKGIYSLYLPAGKYYVGADRSFPPEGKSLSGMEIVLDTDMEGVNITLK
ncbi:MAG: hypothetical protein A2X59_10130 [Nitrospirae bacterium GWC2_42_7]|nr:MAG: hypothetical protein A2X59_10130 [Nitrospirae bacterium GWC2_42_7]